MHHQSSRQKHTGLPQVMCQRQATDGSRTCGRFVRIDGSGRIVSREFDLSLQQGRNFGTSLTTSSNVPRVQLRLDQK